MGEFPVSGVFRPVQPAQAADFDSWLGPDAEEAITTILKSRPPRFAADILEITKEEQRRGFCGPFLTKAQVDDLYGVQWRPLERFLIKQADGKKRCIDNARRTGHNARTTLLETITTVNIDCIATFARMMADGLDLTGPAGDKFPWLDLRIGTDDLPDAYRGLPVADAQHSASWLSTLKRKAGDSHPFMVWPMAWRARSSASTASPSLE